MKPQIDIEHVRNFIVGVLSRIPQHLDESADRKTMWERMEALVPSCARSTNQLGEWWSTLCRRMIVDQSKIVSDDVVARQLINWLRIPDGDERLDEFWRQVRNESAILTALARLQWMERRIKK